MNIFQYSFLRDNTISNLNDNHCFNILSAHNQISIFPLISSLNSHDETNIKWKVYVIIDTVVGLSNSVGKKKLQIFPYYCLSVKHSNVLNFFRSLGLKGT